jgi:uncharacterized membrane protein YhiD involved in acid resistance
VILTLTLGAASSFAQPPPPPKAERKAANFQSDTPDTRTQLEELREAVVRLPLAAALACVLALRPRRRGTPNRQPAVIQTQIILAVIGAVVMLVVGSSLARAFGIVGAAGLVRYRAKIADPKDAGVMLSTLAVGLACGVGLWVLALFGTAFILTVLWVIESFEPQATRLFTLTIKTKEPPKLKDRIEQVLTRSRAPFEVRTVGQAELQYEVRWPLDKKTDRLSETLLGLAPAGSTEVEWEPIADKKK